MVRERRMWSVVEGNVERRRMWSVAGWRALEMGIRKGCEAQQRSGREGEHDVGGFAANALLRQNKCETKLLANNNNLPRR